jgi:hypothetical protein
MDHAEAHELLADLALEPSALDTLAAADDPASRALRAHVAACPLCSADLSSWRRTWAAVGASHRRGHAAADRDAADQDSADQDAGRPRLLAPPADLRARVLKAIGPSPAAGAPVGMVADRAGAPAPRRFVTLKRRAVGLVAVAAVAAAVLAGGTAVQSRLDLQRSQTEAAALASVESAVSRILAEPGHTEVPLRAADGSSGGVLAWGQDEFVVLTSDLAEPGEGQTYRCWIELNGTRTVIGELSFSGSMAAWSGSMSGWQWYFTPGAMFGVSLYSASGPSAQPVLAATL